MGWFDKEFRLTGCAAISGFTARRSRALPRASITGDRSSGRRPRCWINGSVASLFFDSERTWIADRRVDRSSDVSRRTTSSRVSGSG